MISPNASSGSRVVDSVPSKGTVSSVPSTPKPISSGRRPIRSDNAPNTGCRTMNRNSEFAETSVDWSLVSPTVFTKNFCM